MVINIENEIGILSSTFRWDYHPITPYTHEKGMDPVLTAYRPDIM